MPQSGDRQELNRRVLELTTLYEISKLLGSCLDLNECLMGTLRLLSSFMGMREGTILLSDPLLIEHFLAKYNRENNRRVRLTGRALQLLLGHEWPGNVRELENCIERMVIMARRRILLPEDLPLPLQPPTEESHDSTPRPPQPSRRRLAASDAVLPTLRAMEREQIVKALTQSGGIQARAAALLGITPRQFAYRLRKYGIIRTFQVEGAPLIRQV